MRSALLLAVVFLLLLCLPVAAQESLREWYEQAGPNGEYDKFVELDPAMEYYGDLSLYDVGNICIMGNGAKILADPDDQNPILIGVAACRIDIQNCLFIGGMGAIYIAVNSSGTIKNNTIIGTYNTAIRTYTIGDDNELYIYDNIIIDSYDGLICNEYEQPSYLGYNTTYNCTRYRYAEFCEG